jgi:predicted ArsR family transcriptional regulator
VPAVIDVVQPAERLRGGMSPLRRSVLEQLKEPASAVGLATRLGASRQRVAYHIRELEKAGLVEVVEERARRGCTERIVRLTARAVVLAPEVIGDLATTGQDRFAADVLLAISARTVNDVAAMRQRADAQGRRLITFAVEADIGFDQPADIERFADRLAESLMGLATEFDTGRTDHRYRVIVGGHPMPRTSTADTSTAQEGT